MDELLPHLGLTFDLTVKRNKLYPMNIGSSLSVSGWAELYGDGSGVLLDSVGDGDGALHRKSLIVQMVLGIR